jgi:hypothetical protein
MDFAAAVESLTVAAAVTEYKAPPKISAPPKPQKPFALPKRNVNNDKVFAYLRGRGISKETLNRCIGAGILYESAKTNRCVFVGKDGDTPKFAFERGTADNWKKDVAGSSKKFSFCLPPQNPDSRTLIVTESPIDALAHADIHAIGQTGIDGYRLSLGGVSSSALTVFLERDPGIQNIFLALDNDAAGKDAANRIIRELLSDKWFSRVKITVTPPPSGFKDYAETLQAIRRLNIEKAAQSRSKEAAI